MIFIEGKPRVRFLSGSFQVSSVFNFLIQYGGLDIQANKQPGKYSVLNECVRYMTKYNILINALEVGN